MSDRIAPKFSVDLLVQLTYLIEAKDKALKIAGSAAKVAATRDSPIRKDLRGFASQLSAARRWMKFGKILRSTPELLNPFAVFASFPYKSASVGDYVVLFLNRCEFFADIVQMVSEDINTLHKASLWTKAFGLKPISDLDVIEDRAWWVWSFLAFLNSYISMRAIRSELVSAQLRLEALNPAAASEEISRMTVRVTVLKVKYYLELFKCVKFFCELVDSSIALTPDYLKALNPRWFELVSCCVGSVSAVSSLHKIMLTESNKISQSK